MVRLLPTLVVAALATAAPARAQLTPTAGPVLSTSTVSVDDRLHLQTNPHVSGDFVVYTDFSNGGEILLRDLSKNVTSLAVARPAGHQDQLSDISDRTIVFQRITTTEQFIYAAPIAADGTPGTAVPLAPRGAQLRSRASVGGDTVAFEDTSFSNGLPVPELAVASVARPADDAVRITFDDLSDESPSVSADGNSIVFEKCQSPNSGCTIARAVRAGGAWSVQALTTDVWPAPAMGIVPHDTLPTTTGEVTVYGSNRSGDEDIWMAVPNGAGGFDHFYLSLAGYQWRPTIARDFIAFESGATRSGPFDIYLFHRTTNTLYQLTSTGTVNETLTDLSVSADGLVRVVWAQAKADDRRDLDVYALSAVISSPTPCEEDLDDDGEADDPVEQCERALAGERDALATVAITRSLTAPQVKSVDFDAAGGEGLLCVENARATSGVVTLNGDVEVGPDSFKRKTTLIGREIDLATRNTLAAKIAGEPGSSYKVTVFPASAACEASLASRSGKSGARAVAALRDASAKVETLQPIAGTRSSVLSDRTRVIEESQFVALGCSSTGDGVALGAMVMVALWWVSRRRAVPVRVRRRR